MDPIAIVGLDLAKRVFQVHGARADGSIVLRKKLSRPQVLTFFAQLPACVVAMEACASAHEWGRAIRKLGHEVRLIPPVYVKPFLKRQKNDAADAEAIAEAALRPTMRFVAIKSESQQARAMIFRTRDLLVRQRTQLINALRGHLAEHVDIDAILAADKLARLALISKGVEALIAPDEQRRQFFRRAGAATRAYKALLPDERAAPFLKPVAALHVLAEAVRAKLGPVDISALSAKIEALLDEKIEGVAITAPIIQGDNAASRVDLSSIDFEKLAKLFATQPKTAGEQLKASAEKKAQEMAQRNPTRVHLVEKLERLVNDYNLGTLASDTFFEALKKLISEMEEEERRGAREGLTEDELAIFDLLTKPEPKLTKAQEDEVKRVARELLEKLQEHLRVAGWQLRVRPRATVQSTIRFTLNDLPEDPYSEEIWEGKVDAVWQFVFTRYQTGGAVEARV